MIGKDIEGNEYAVRHATDEEKQRVLDWGEYDHRGGLNQMLLLDDGYTGAAWPQEMADRVAYFTGLCYDKGEETIIVDGDRYTAWIWDYMAPKNEYELHGTVIEMDKKETNLWYTFLGPIMEPHNYGPEE